MARAIRRRSAQDDELERDETPAEAPEAGVAEVLRLQRTAGNQAVAALVAQSSPQGNAQQLARTATVAPPVSSRAPIDALAKQQNVKPADRAAAYAKIAGTSAVQMDPAVVHSSGPAKDGINLVTLVQAGNVPAKADFVDVAGRLSGGAPPQNAAGVAIVINSTSNRFEDEDYMVAAIRHEMVHARLMRLTLKHRDDWKANGRGLSFSQYVDKHVGGSDGALVRDRFFGGHMDETVAYAEGFLSAFFYAPVEPPDGKERAWITHLEGFGKEFQKARNNAIVIPKDKRAGIDEQNLAIRESANAVVAESENLVTEYCNGGGRSRRENLAVWMEFLAKAGGIYKPALAMIYKVATLGKKLP